MKRFLLTFTFLCAIAAPHARAQTVGAYVSGNGATSGHALKSTGGGGLEDTGLPPMAFNPSSTTPSDCVQVDATGLLLADAGFSCPQIVTYFITSSQTITLPTNWHSIYYGIIGGGGGGGCGYVVTSGTAAYSGAGGGDSTPKWGIILASQYPYSSVVISIAAGGNGCVASGTTSGSTGSGANAGGVTTLTMNSTLIDTSWAGFGGISGSLTNTVYGGGGGGFCGSGTVGTGGACGGLNQGNTATVPWLGSPGQNGAIGQPGASSCNAGLAIAPAGSGLTATPTATAGRAGVSACPLVSTGGGTAGSNACTGTSANGGNATDNAPLNALTGATGGSGASCTAANGGNAGASAGYGVGGAGGGDTLVGFMAGSGANGQPGAAYLVIQ